MDKKNFGWISFSVVVLNLVVSSRTVAQEEVPRVEWERTFGGAAHEGLSSVQQTADGGYIAAGGTKSFGLGGGDIYVIKVNAQGNLDPRWGTEWPENPKTFGGAGLDFPASVQQTADGGYIVVGYTNSFSPGIRPDVYLLKLDLQGNPDPKWGTEWPQNPKTHGGEGQEWINSGRQTVDGGYIVAGRTDSFGAGDDDFYLLKLDAQGELDPAWTQNPRTFGGADSDEARSVQQTADGGYIVVGTTRSFGVGTMLVKLDAEGNLDPRWGTQRPRNPKTFDRPSVPRSVQQTADGGYIVAGSGRSVGDGSIDVYLIKLDAQGDLDPTWGTQSPENPRNFGGVETDNAWSVRQTADGGFIVAGETESFGAGGDDVYLLKLDAQGNVDPRWDTQWPHNSRTFGGAEDDRARSVQQTADGGYIVAGSTSSSGAGEGDAYLIKLAPVSASSSFHRGDANDDGRIDVTDAVSLLNFLFGGGEETNCKETQDFDNDGRVILTDAVSILLFLFVGGPAPAAPGPTAEDCGPDPDQSGTPGDLGCRTYGSC